MALYMGLQVVLAISSFFRLQYDGDLSNVRNEIGYGTLVMDA